MAAKPPQGETVTVSLSGCSAKQDIFVRFGEIFEFGGPNANHLVRKNTGWGMSWDALQDSLREVGNGGIWGTSKRFQFPLHVQIEHCRRMDSTALDTLKDVLQQAQEEHGKLADGKDKFTFAFV